MIKIKPLPAPTMLNVRQIFFGFNSNMELEYRGRLNNRRDGGTAISHELFDAMMEIKKTGKGPVQQLPSIGCSIKWAD